jgi:hypothetical protein
MQLKQTSLHVFMLFNLLYPASSLLLATSSDATYSLSIMFLFFYLLSNTIIKQFSYVHFSSKLSTPIKQTLVRLSTILQVVAQPFLFWAALPHLFLGCFPGIHASPCFLKPVELDAIAYVRHYTFGCAAGQTTTAGKV